MVNQTAKPQALVIFFCPKYYYVIGVFFFKKRFSKCIFCGLYVWLRKKNLRIYILSKLLSLSEINHKKTHICQISIQLAIQYLVHGCVISQKYLGNGHHKGTLGII